jgi:Tol biopolymer transport system component
LGDRRWLALAVAAAMVAGGLVPARAAAAVPANPAAPAGPQLASVSASGEQGNSGNWWARVSRDGRYVAFTSLANNLVTNRPVQEYITNVYLKDRLTGSIQLISHASGGADGDSYPIDVSADGQYVLFVSSATNLVDNDTNDVADLFRWNRSVDGNTLISADDAGTQSAWPSVSAWGYRDAMTDDGRFVVFEAPSGVDGGGDQIYVRNLQDHTTDLVSANVDGNPNNGYNGHPVISGNGRFVAFQSNATDLVDPPPSTTPTGYIYVRDLMFGITWLVSLPSGGDNDRRPAINEDGSVVAYEGHQGILVWNMFTFNGTVRADCGAAGMANGESRYPVLNADGTVLAFESYATNLDPDRDTNGVRDIFVTVPGLCAATHRVNTAGRGCQAHGTSDVGDLSADGTLIVFASNAKDLTYRDGTKWHDVFVAPTRSHQPTEESNCAPVND